MTSLLDLSPGAIFAEQFKVVRPLARGGMGAVYVVEQLGTARERALKLMHPMLAADERSVERFTREAQVASRIDSDHVVEVVAAGVDRKTSTPWLCMELLKGETLAERVERAGRLSIGETLEVVRQLGHALSAAHRAGIVHRDLKPENIFLATPRREGIPFTLKVLDFGVAALVHDSTGGGSKATQGVGSPMWMAPEQTNVGRVTCATDVWALGLVVFYLLTAKSYWKAPTIEGSSLTALLVEIMVEPLEPATLRAEQLLAKGLLPPGFDGWFARAVARDPGHRYPEAGAAIVDLVLVLEASERGHAPPQIRNDAAFAETGAMASGYESVPPARGMPVTQVSPLATQVPMPARDVATAVSAPQRAPMWPWILAGVVGCVIVGGIAGTYAIFLGMEAAAEELATLAPPVGVDGEGSDIHFGPEGVEIRTESGESVTVSGDGIEVDSADPLSRERTRPAIPEGVERDGVRADEPQRAEEEESEGESESESESEGEGEGEIEGEIEGESESDVEATPAPRARAPRPHRDGAAAVQLRRSVTDYCWRGQFEGEAVPPSVPWTFDLMLDASGTATNVRITGPTGGRYTGFRSCVVSHVRQFTSPDGTDHIVLSLP